MLEPEIGVASTKAFIGQMLVLYILSLKISEIRKEISQTEYKRMIKNLKILPDLITKTLNCEGKIQTNCKRYSSF